MHISRFQIKKQTKKEKKKQLPAKMDAQGKGSRHSYRLRHSPAENENLSSRRGPNQEKNNVDVLNKHWANTTGIQPFVKCYLLTRCRNNLKH